MENFDQNKLLSSHFLFATLSNQACLKIINFLIDTEKSVQQIMAFLELDHSTISEHLNQLRTIGFLKLRSDGNQNLYSLNTLTFRNLGKDIAALDTFRFNFIQDEADYSWIDNLDLDEFSRKTLRECTQNQRLTHIPRQQAKLLVVLEWLVTFFEKDRLYTEQEINEILRHRYDDFVGLRRDLVDMGYLRRDRRGSKYLFEGSFLQY